ncbi:transposase [Streptomyces sp. NPDC127190]|uniref:transposase n=1 Tax=unclassified Streptomyces TaxID=2593676 RepID=UPI003636DF34
MPLRRYRYPSDTSAPEWALLERFLPTPACQAPKGGAPEKWPRRSIVDAIRYKWLQQQKQPAIWARLLPNSRND